MATWTQRSIGSQVIDSLTAGKITTGTLQAGTTINVGDPAGVHTAIGQGAVRIMRPDSDGVVTPVITMGGATRDVVQIVDPDTGATVAGLGDDGSVVGQEVIADSLTVGGAKIGNPYDPEDLLWLFARGAVGFEPSAATDAAGNTRYGVIEASAQVQGGRLYRVSFYGTLHQRNDGSNQTSYITFFRTLDGSAPSINSAVLHSGSVIFPILGNVTLLTPAMAYIDVGADRVRRSGHPLAHERGAGVAARGGEPHEVPLGQDADRPHIVDRDHRAHTVLAHRRGRLGHLVVGVHGDDGPAHDVGDRARLAGF